MQETIDIAQKRRGLAMYLASRLVMATSEWSKDSDPQVLVDIVTDVFKDWE
jgi:hypothetical protein